MWNVKTTELIGELLQEMGERLGFQFDDVEIRKGACSPIAHEDQETANNLIRYRLVRILGGEECLNVRVVADNEEPAIRSDSTSGSTQHIQATEHRSAE